MPTASTTFLFDQHRTGRTPFGIGTAEAPSELWKTWLPSHPSKGAESSPAFDTEGNLYFGSHDGCFYSLSNSGKVRWMFKTDEKIYSSPQLIDDKVVVFAGGNGYLYAFSTDGDLLWHYDLCQGFRPAGAVKRAIATLKELPVTLDWKRKYLVTTKSWASPSLHSEGFLIATGYGKGLHAVNLDGSGRWKFDLGAPQYSLSGTCLDNDGNILVTALEGAAYSVDANGKQNWKTSLPKGFKNWGTPSFDPELLQGYFPVSKKEESAFVFALDPSGSVRWKAEVPGGIRGSVSIGTGDHAIVCGLAGEVIYLNRKTGTVDRKVRLSKDSRALWTTAAIDPEGHILLTTKETNTTGSLACLTADGVLKWSTPIGKALSTPVIDAEGRIYVGSWDGYYRCIQS